MLPTGNAAFGRSLDLSHATWLEPLRRTELFLSSLLCGLIAIFLAWSFPLASRTPVGVDYDSAIYLDLAWSLSDGAGFRHRNVPGAPLGVHFPPLHPAVLAVWDWVGRPRTEHRLMWAQAGMTLVMFLAVAGWVSWALRYWGRLAGGLTAAAFVVSPVLHQYVRLPYAEPLCWTLLAAGAHGLLHPRGTSVSRITTALAVVSVALLPLARTAVLPVTVVFAITVLVGRWPALSEMPAWQRAVLSCWMILPTVGWIQWQQAHSAEIPPSWLLSYGPYSGTLRAANLTALEVLQLSGAHAGQLVPAFASAVPGGILIVLCFAVVVGRPWRRSDGVTPWMTGAIGSAIPLAVWPTVHPRFWLATLPMFVAYAVLAMTEAIPRRRWRVTLKSWAWRSLLLGLVVATVLWVSRAHLIARSVEQSLAEWHNDLALLAERASREPRTRHIVAPFEPYFALAIGRAVAPAADFDSRHFLEKRASLVRYPLRENLCMAGAGLLLVPHAQGELGIAWRRLRDTVNASVQFGAPEPVGRNAEVVAFTCNTQE